MFTDIIMPLDGHAPVDYSTVGLLLDIPPSRMVHLSMARSYGIGLITNIVPLDILCYDYSTLANHVPIQLQRCMIPGF